MPQPQTKKAALFQMEKLHHVVVEPQQAETDKSKKQNVDFGADRINMGDVHAHVFCQREKQEKQQADHGNQQQAAADRRPLFVLMKPVKNRRFPVKSIPGDLETPGKS